MSARLERFLALAAETNLRVVYPTTAAQYFHLLRRQAGILTTDPLPLVVMTPKSLLRHPLAASTPRELAEGRWQSVLDDPHARAHPEQVTRLVLMSGKVYVDLASGLEREPHPEIALVRLEQLYPFRADKLSEVLDRYSRIEEIIWLQEEPENMGAWTYIQPRLRELLNGRVPLRLISRPANASPAEGSTAMHNLNQRALVQSAFAPTPEPVAA